MRVEQLKMMPAGVDSLSVKPPVDDSQNKTFGEFLSDALGETNKLQHEANKASFDLASGQIQDVSEVVIAAEKASVALQLTMQVRNKVVDAYQEIMRMQV